MAQVRDVGIEINKKLEGIGEEICVPMQLINVGEVANDRTADTIAIAMNKILSNLSTILHQLQTLDS